MGTRAVSAMFFGLLLAGCGPSREASLEAQVKTLQLQLQQAQDQAQALRFERDGLREKIDAATATAVQLRGRTQFLRSATTQLADSVNRLSYEDWNKVVPDVQLNFSDVEGAAGDLDDRVQRVVNALGDRSGGVGR